MKMPIDSRSIPVADRGLYNALFAMQNFMPRSERIQQWRDSVRLRIADHLRRGGPGKVHEIQRVRGLSAEDFRAHYLATGTPVILDRAAAEWPCTKKWSFDSFRERFGAATIKIVHHKGLSDEGGDHEGEYSDVLNFGAFLDQVQAGSSKYMRFSPILEQFPELLQDFDREFLRTMPGWMSLGTTFEAFIGGKKTFTPLHNAPTPFFFVNVCGVKRWSMIPNHYISVLNPPADGMS